MELVQDTLTSLLTVQGKTFLIPSFQRPYKWEEDHWNDLFIDITRAYEKRTGHFMGAIVMQKIEKNEEILYVIIDGQQRLTTISLCLLALAKWIKEFNSGNTYLYNTTIKDFLITNKLDGSEVKRIVLSNKHENNLLYSDVIDKFYSNGLTKENLGRGRNIFSEVVDYFYNQINSYYNDETSNLDINNFVNGFFTTISQYLKFIMINLGSNEDANMIFETLNTRGKPLVPGELIRNYIFMHPKIIHADDLYNKFWEPLEKCFEKLEKDKITDFSEFIKHFVYANKEDTRLLKNSSTHVYLEVKDFLNDFLEEKEVIELMSKLIEYRDYYNYLIAPNTIPKSYSERIIVCLSMLMHLKINVYTPIILKLFEQHNNNLISMETLEENIALITSYSIRLTLNGRKKPNKMIPEIIYVITNFEDEKLIAQEVEKIIHRQTSSPFYTDEDLLKMVAENALYSNPKLNFTKYLLLTLFRYDSKSNLADSNIGELTLEHIFPQNDQLWVDNLTEEELEQNRKLLNTIGNLTLVNQKLNSTMSNSPFVQKRLYLNKFSIWYYERENYFGNNTEQWNAEKIIDRAKILGAIIIKLLPGPNKQLMNSLKSKPDFVVKINDSVIQEKNQKNTYIKAIKRIHEITDEITWSRINIKGCAAGDKGRFTTHQKSHLIQVGPIYVNYHANLFEKKQRLIKIAQFCNVKIEF